MSTGLLSQLDAYYSRIDEMQDPIRPDEIAESLDSVRVLPLAPSASAGQSPARRVWVAAAAAVAVFVLVGGVAWLTAGPAGGDPSDKPTVTTTVLPAVDRLGLAWTQVALDEATFGPDTHLVAAAASESMVVIGGRALGSAAIWTSVDRVTWTRVPHDEDVFGGPGNQEIKAIVPWRSGFVAAGEVRHLDDFDPNRVAIVWYSEDGHSWHRVPHDEAIFGGVGRQEVYSMAATEDDLIIVGFDEEGPHDASGDGTVAWTSSDGVTWSKVIDPVGDEVLGVTAHQDGFVAVGHRADSAAVWSVSADGVDWQRIAGVAELGAGVPLDVVSVPSGLIVVGISGTAGGERPAVWKPSEGTWERTDFDALAEGVPVFGSIAASNSGLAIVGRGGDSGGDSAILVSLDGDQWHRGRGTNSQIQSTLHSIVGFQGHFVVVGNDFDREPQIWTTMGETDS